ncbi:hypothetical protein ACTXT7_007764 [Hymenolepis weldensis]
MIDIQVQLDNIASVNADVWQRVIALDASYLRKRPSTSSYLNPARWNIYLRRRYQLSQNSSPQCPVDRSEYLIIRENLLNQKYGPVSPPESNADTITPTTEPTPYNILLLDRQQHHSLSQFSTSSTASQLPITDISLRKNENTAPVSTGYAFAGIETIFDHHKADYVREILQLPYRISTGPFYHYRGSTCSEPTLFFFQFPAPHFFLSLIPLRFWNTKLSNSTLGLLILTKAVVSDSITRIRFAHNDSHLLAIASADGTASICHIAKSDPSTTTPVSHRIDYLQLPQPLPTTPTTKNLNQYPPPPAAIMDIAWSVANDFVATVSLDSSLCLWDVNRRGALARHLRDVATPGGGLMVCEFHPVNNNYLILGDTMGLVQFFIIIYSDEISSFFLKLAFQGVLNLSTGRIAKNGQDKLHTPPGMRIKLPPCRNRTDLSHYLGRGCITALAIDPRTCRLWVGSDLGVIQAYSCNEATGSLMRLRQLTVFTPIPQTFLPSVTSLDFCAWLSHEDSSSYLLVNSAGVGLLLYRVDPANGALELQHQFDLQHSPLCNPPASNYGLHLLHSCFAPLISFRASGTACAISASEDKASVYVFEVPTTASEKRQEAAGRVRRRRSHSGAVVTRLQGHDCEVGKTVVDVCLSWDESVLASADEAGVVILWKRQAEEKTS